VKAAWVRPGGPLYPAKRDVFKAQGGRQFFYDATDPALTAHPEVLPALRAGGWWVGTTRDPTWTTPTPDPITFAEMLSADLDKYAGPGIQHGTIMDVETHNVEYARLVIVNFRALRPGRYLYWTFEPFQGGLITDAIAQLVNADPYTWWLPQLYFGESVDPAFRYVSERAVLNDLEQTTIHDAKVKCYYDRLEAGWDGVLFDWTNIAAHLP